MHLVAADYFHACEVARAQFEILILIRFDHQNLLRRFELLQRLREAFGLVIGEREARYDLQIAVAQFHGERRAQCAQLHLARQPVAVVAGHRSVDRAAMPPDGAPHRTHSRASRALLFPEFLAGAGDFVPGFDFVSAGALSREIVPDGFVQQVFVDFRAEHRVGQLDFPDFVIVQIYDVYCGHDYLFALRTTT